jgi:V8-like Glu-specific endopeptidase
VIPRFKVSLALAAFGLLAAGALQQAAAQSGTTVETFYAIGLEHAQHHPYNFTGRVFNFGDVAVYIGTGTLIRRHTVLTAGHIAFDPIAGFASNASFSRGLYGNYFLSDQQVNAVGVLAGYQAAAIAAGSGVESVASSELDLGYLIVTDPPVDEDWGVYDADPTQLTNNDQRFILGYPGSTFDGRTMAYLVPTSPYVQVGIGDTGAYSNDLYLVEGGFSGGPVYAVVDGQQVIVAELTAGDTDDTGEFTYNTVRAVDTTAAKFLQDAEYTNGLIRKVGIVGPTTAPRGVPLIYTLKVRFAVLNDDGTHATTNRYPELRLKSDTPGTSTAPLTTITKLSNTQFQVTYSTTLRSGSTVNLTGYYDKDMPAPLSTLAVLLK